MEIDGFENLGDGMGIASPPGHHPELSEASRRLFAELIAEYAIEDSGGRQILLAGLLAKDVADDADAALKRDGLVTPDKWGQSKPHPCIAAARDFRAQWLHALKLLNLKIGEPPTVGRPEGA